MPHAAAAAHLSGETGEETVVSCPWVARLEHWTALRWCPCRVRSNENNRGAWTAARPAPNPPPPPAWDTTDRELVPASLPGESARGGWAVATDGWRLADAVVPVYDRSGCGGGGCGLDATWTQKRHGGCHTAAAAPRPGVQSRVCAESRAGRWGRCGGAVMQRVARRLLCTSCAEPTL